MGHSQNADHWVVGRVAAPISLYSEYRDSRATFGLDQPGSFVVEVEAESGEVGVAQSSGGPPACYIVERHLARFVEGADPRRTERIWDLMWRGSMHYGRRGLVVHAISAVDLALWDLVGKLRGEPIHALIGGAVRDELPLYATGPHADVARELGFIGAKLPLVYGPADGDEGLRKNVEIAERARAALGDDLLLAYDCWMALDVPYTLRLLDALCEVDLHWLEEFLPPDDYWGYAEVKRRAPRGPLLATGEHEATRWGFRQLIELGCCDIVQPDIAWCGGLSELLKIAALCEARGLPVVPHGQSVYSYHFSITRPLTPFAEFFMASPDGRSVAPFFGHLLVGEPLPEQGRVPLTALDRPGFGLELNPQAELERPFPH